MHHELETQPDPDAVARAAAAFVAERARAAVAANGSFHFAVSGGHTRARQILWLVTGADKKDPLARLLSGDIAIPAGRVEAAASLVMADRAAT
jgi:6-phosphogluconolactonase/glucosamine-6-phosphate isomerase/deaminase